ncbi:MAG TPA: hypothetical protein DCQ06_02095 [Myxococcales bacterium]|nr:hypothetical protein [Myxococcales bacterium]
MSNMTWLALALIGSSLSLAVALIRLWRRKINTPNEAPLRDATGDSPRFNQGWNESLSVPEVGFIPPPSVAAAELVWTHKVQGEPTLWLSRQADKAWWVTWYAPWRRGLADELECTTHAQSAYGTSLELGAGLWTHWRSSTPDLRPTLAADAELWRLAQLFGVRPTILRGDECVALRMGLNNVHSAFDLSCLAGLAVLIDRRAREGTLPQAGLCGPVALRIDAVTYGDIPPFGTIQSVGNGAGCRFVGIGSRSEEGVMDDSWDHGWTLFGDESYVEHLAPTQAADLGSATTRVRLSDGSVAEIWALDGNTQGLRQTLRESGVELFNTI